MHPMHKYSKLFTLVTIVTIQLLINVSTETIYNVSSVNRVLTGMKWYTTTIFKGLDKRETQIFQMKI